MRVVLVVEDEPLIRMLAIELLEDAGHVVVDFATAAQAIAFCEVPANDVGAVLTDINMPGDLDGLDLARHVAATRPKTQVVVTSGRVDALPHDMPDTIRFLAKPWARHSILQAIGAPAL